MRKLVAIILVLAGASLAFSQQTQRNGSFDKLTVRNTMTVGKWNGNCIVDGVQNTTLAAAVACAGTSGVIEIPMFAVPSFVSATIPAGVTLRFDGPSCLNNSGTLTINGPIVAGNYQIFCGAGTIVLGNNATIASVQWFPGATADVQINNCNAALANGGFCDARGYGGSLQTIAATVNIGTNTAPGKTITLWVDRNTTYTCTTNITTPMFKVNGGSTFMAFGMVPYPNAGIVVGNGCTTSNGLLVQGSNLGIGLVGGFAEGAFVRALTGSTVTDGLCAAENTLQLTKITNTSCGVQGGTVPVAFKAGGVGSNPISINLQLDYDQFDCQGNAGCRPIWIGCGTPAANASCGTGAITSMTFIGGLAVHAGTGLPIVTVEASDGAGGTNLVDNINFYGYQIENKSGDTTQIGFLDDGASSFHIYGLNVTSQGGGGADVIKITNTAGVNTDGVDVTFSLCCGGWTNAINNLANSRIITTATPRMHYIYNRGAQVNSNFWDDGNGNMLSFDSSGLTLGSGFRIAGGGVNRYLGTNNGPPTLSGFGTSPTISGNGTYAFIVNVGTGGTASSGTFTFAVAANHGWSVHCDDITTNSTAVFLTKQTGGSTTTATIANYSDVAVLTAWASGDTLNCTAFGN